MVQENIDTSNSLDHIISSIPGLIKTDLEDRLPDDTTKEHRQKELSTIREIIATITSTLDLNQASSAFLTAIQKLVNCQITTIYSIDKADDTVNLILFASTIPVRHEPGHSWTLSGSAIEEHLKTNSPHIEHELDQLTRFESTQKYTASGIKTTLWAPIINQGQTIGVLVLRSKEIDAFNDGDIYWIRHLTNLMAPSIEAASQYQETLQVQAFTQALNQVAINLNHTLDTNRVLERICKECYQLLNTSSAVLVEIEGGETPRKASWPPKLNNIPQNETVEEDIALQVSLTNKTKLVTDIIHPYDAISTQQTTVAIPLAENGRVIGVLIIEYALTYRSFTKKHLRIAETFALHATTALQNARLHEAVQNYAAEISLVDKVAKIITSTLNIDEVYEQFALELKKVVDFDRANINLVAEDNKVYVFKYFYGQSEHGRQAGDIITLSGTQTEHVLKTGQTLIRENLQAEPKFPSDHINTDLGLKSVIAVPLICNNKIIGVLGLRNKKASAYGSREQVILERLASQIAPAVENTWLNEKLQSNSQEIAVVDEVARIITSTLNIEEVYEKFALEVKKLINFDRVVINIINQDDNTFTRKYLIGKARPGLPIGSSSPLEGTQNQHVITTGKTLLRDNTKQDSRFPSDRDMGQIGMTASILVPLISKNNVIGTMGMRSSKIGAFGPKEQSILERLARQIAPALENSQLYETTRIEKERATTALANLNEYEAALRESEEKYRTLFEESRDAIYLCSPQGQFLEINQASLDLFGYNKEELKQMQCWDLFTNPKDLKKFQREITKRGSIIDFETSLRRKDGPALTCLITCTMRQAEDKQICGYQSIVHDITERKQLEAQFLQSQKMESMGRLASGIAHDFNNLLAGILGFSSLLKNRVDPNSEAHEFAEIIEKATQRGAQLTQQLLTSVRKTPFEIRPIDVNEAMQDVVQILSRTLPKGVNIVSHFQPTLPLIQGDIGQIHQVIMNLCINASDAMPTGGTLSLSNNTTELDEAFCRHHLDLQPGQHIQLTISDTGMGISEEDQTKIFEPFFTTKLTGKGTGLGLSVAYGVVKNHHGTIEVKSKPNKGSTFTIYLPVSRTPLSELPD